MKAFKNIVGKGNILVNSICTFFPQYFLLFSLPKTNFNFQVTFISLSANALNFSKAQTLLLGKELLIFNCLEEHKNSCPTWVAQW